jgi:hypothetical protein
MNMDTPNVVPFDSQESPVRRPRPKPRPANKSATQSRLKGKENQRPTTIVHQPQTVTLPVIPEAAPKWFKDAVSLFVKGGLGDEWMNCVNDWMAAEERFDFSTADGKVCAPLDTI